MDFDEQLRIRQSAKGDPARLALASVDLLMAARPERERENVRTALEAAAVVHWCNEAILAALLNITVAEAVTRLVRLRELTVVEPFPARGPGVVNVHEAIRLALRARLHAEDPNRLRTLSARAHAHFANDNASHAVVEALYHRFIGEPTVAERECRKLYRRLSDAGEYEALLALGGILAELLDSDQPGLAEGGCAARRSSVSAAFAAGIRDCRTGRKRPSPSPSERLMSIRLRRRTGASPWPIKT